MNHSIHHCARSLVDVCSGLPEKEFAAACDAVLELMSREGFRIADRRHLVRVVREELASAGASLAVKLQTPSGSSGDNNKMIAHALEEALGRKIELEETVNRDLIGGVRIAYGDERLDYSVHGALTRLTAHLISA